MVDLYKQPHNSKQKCKNNINFWINNLLDNIPAYNYTCIYSVHDQTIVNSGNARNLENIKEATKQAKSGLGRSLTLHTFCFLLLDYAWIT